jgi:hypothetical protein
MSNHDHPLPPPEVDNIDAFGVSFWGVASFVSLVVSIFAMTTYFWLERVQEDTNKVYASTYFLKLQMSQDAAVQDRLHDVKPLWEVSKQNRTEKLYNSVEKAKQYSISGGPDQINGRKILKSGKFQLPIEHAMTLVMADRARHFVNPKTKKGAK